MKFCSKCGAPLPPDSSFCPRCGTAVAADAPPPVSPAPPPSHSHRAAWWIVPVVLVVLALLGWLVLAGLPFGGRESRRAAPDDDTETIAEGTTREAPRTDVGTIVDVSEPPPAPPVTTTTAAATQPATAPPPVVPPREISDAEATAVLRGAITSVNYYESVGPECIEIRSLGYENVGYTFSVWDRCLAGGGSRLLGRWRVDSRTREVFRQREDGRYLRP